MRNVFPYLLSVSVLLVTVAFNADCQNRGRKKEARTVIAPGVPGHESGKKAGGYMEYIVEGNDTIYVGLLDEAKIFSRLPRQKGKDWRQYYKLVYNFSRTYPYALAGRKMMAQVDSTIDESDAGKMKREKYIRDVEAELFRKFEKDLRNMTVSQGALLMRLVDRECGMCPYDIIKEYLNGMAAGFWQGVAKVFGTDLKRRYDPKGKDSLIEELVEIWESGDFEAFYISLFWEEPKKINIDDNVDSKMKSRR